MYYYRGIFFDNICFSVDMVRLKLDFCTEERIKKFGDYLSSVFRIYIDQYPISYKAYGYRNLFKITCANNESFVIGLVFNGSSADSRFLGFMEFNPNKVAEQPEFKDIFEELRIHCFTAEVSRWDLAVDVPLPRELCVLQKDKRKYTLIRNSESDKTEYLGIRNKSGFVKLYNKKIESKLDYELTRMELTLTGDCTFDDFCTLLPRIDVKGEQHNFKPYLELNKTDIVLYELLMKCDIIERKEYLSRLGRIKGDKLRPYVTGNKCDSDKFIVPRDVFRKLKKQLCDWMINIDLTIFEK